jgi:hypothetical protein
MIGSATLVMTQAAPTVTNICLKKERKTINKGLTFTLKFLTYCILGKIRGHIKLMPLLNTVFSEPKKNYFIAFILMNKCLYI